ncbi:hypothetical protein J3F83DRAFT_747653 [Trichoderma novae-zelandiae]
MSRLIVFFCLFLMQNVIASREFKKRNKAKRQKKIRKKRSSLRVVDEILRRKLASPRWPETISDRQRSVTESRANVTARLTGFQAEKTPDAC